MNTRERALKALEQVYDESKKQDYSEFMREQHPDLKDIMYLLRYLKDEGLIEFLDIDDGLANGIFRFRIKSKGIDLIENEVKPK